MSNEIVNKIAEWLQISVEKAVEIYPQLRTEAVWYSMTINLLYVLGSAVAASLIATFILWMDCNIYEDERDEPYKRKFKIFFKLSVVLGLLILVIVTVSPFLYPNIVFFKHFVK